MKIKIEKECDGRFYLYRLEKTGLFRREKWVSAHWNGYEKLEDAQERAKFLTTPYVEIVESK